MRSGGNGVRGVNLLVNFENDGLRIVPQLSTSPSIRAPNVINGISNNNFNAGAAGATMAGGGSVTINLTTQISANLVTGDHGSVGGGHGNTAGLLVTVAGGSFNTASGSSSMVAGGGSNTASGTLATVAGGADNTAAGGYSFAAGGSAKANHNGAFVWGDSTADDVTSTAINQFVIRANGGIRLPEAGENQPGNAAKQSGTNMFTHVVRASRPCQPSSVSNSRTAIDHPLTNGNPNAILVVTNLGSVSNAASVLPEPPPCIVNPRLNPVVARPTAG